MKKQKIWSMIMLVVMMLPLMVACGGDDGNNEDGGARRTDLINQAIGVWMCIESTDIQGDDTYNGFMVGKEVEIKNGGTYSSISSSFGYTGTYTISGNNITAKSSSGATFVITVTINGDKMYWNGTASNGVTFRYVFTRESTNTSQSLTITQEMIAGDFSWKLTNFTIERGSNSYLMKGTTIKFNTDGTCKGFHSMENSYQIVNGMIATFYKQTNEPMYLYTLLSVNGNTVSIRMQGTLDDNLSAVLTLEKQTDVEPQTQTTTDNYMSTRDGVLAVRNGCYSSCSSFIDAQQKLEKLRINNGSGSITSSTSYVRTAWENAYKTINYANTMLDASETSSDFGADMKESEKKEAVAEVRALRAFVYYYVAVLWGNAPLITKSVDATESIQHSSQATLFDFASQEIAAIMETLPSYNIEELGHFTRDAGKALMAELQLTLGNSNNAKSMIMSIDKEKYTGEIPNSITNFNDARYTIWTTGLQNGENGGMSFCPIYTYNHLVMYEKEASGNTSTLADEWKNTKYLDYGYWAALKRMGKAQSVTGCHDYELLMPFPYDYLMFNPNIKQNPGY